MCPCPCFSVLASVSASASRKRSAKGQIEKVRVNVQAPPVKAVPGSARNTPTTQRTPVKARYLGTSETGHLRRQKSPPYARESWRGPPPVPGSNVSTWTLRGVAQERSLVREMESYLEKSERTLMGVHELEDFLLGRADETDDIMFLAVTVCDESGYRMFPVIETSRGQRMADATRCGAAVFLYHISGEDTSKQNNLKRPSSNQRRHKTARCVGFHDLFQSDDTQLRCPLREETYAT